MSAKFAIALNCIDGRIQSPIQQWLKDNHEIDYVDVFTEHGIVKLFSNPEYVEEIKSKVLLSVKQSNSNLVLISAHHDCEGNVVSKDEQISQLKNAVDVVKSWGLSVTVIGVWINENLSVETVV